MKLSSLLSDHLVLQRDKENIIWGATKADTGVKITVSALNDPGEDIVSVVVFSDSCGNFEGTIPAFPAGGPYGIRIEAEGDSAYIDDVLFGDVFLLAGQSNMELPISRTLDINEEYAKSINNTLIRHFEVPKEYDFHGPVSDIYEGSWKRATQENVYDFSALGFYFAEYVNREQNVPVGLLQTACGGIQIEALISKERLLAVGNENRKRAVERGESREKDCICGKNHSCKFCYEDVIACDESDEYVEKCIREDTEEQENFIKWMNENDPGVKAHYEKRTSLYEEGETPEYLSVPIRWEAPYKEEKLGLVRGSVWVLKRFKAPVSCVGKEGKLFLGSIIDGDETYINGVKVGSTDYRYPPRRYPIPEGIIREDNVLVSRIKVSQRRGGFVEGMPYYVRIGHIIIPIDGEYEYRIGANLNPEFKPDPPAVPDSAFFLYRPCGLYNKMIYPLRRMALKAFLFYQAESNCLYYKDYEPLMRAMVDEMRDCFGDPELKLAYIQLPYFGQEDDDRGTTTWDDMRHVQEKCSDIPNSVMIYSYDLGGIAELHPQQKRELAERLYYNFKDMLYM